MTPSCKKRQSCCLLSLYLLYALDYISVIMSPQLSSSKEAYSTSVPLILSCRQLHRFLVPMSEHQSPLRVKLSL